MASVTPPSRARHQTALIVAVDGGHLRFEVISHPLESSKQNRMVFATILFCFGDPSENRTPDTMIKSHVLCQLS